jgi:hypothetical protein
MMWRAQGEDVMKMKAAAALILLALLAGGCVAPDYNGVTVTGTIDLAAVGSPGTCYVELLNDAYGVAAETSAAYPPNFVYTLSNIVEGAYYLRVWLDFGGDGVPDAERYYGSGVLPTPPAAPNVTVPFSGTASYNLTF